MHKTNLSIDFCIHGRVTECGTCQCDTGWTGYNCSKGLIWKLFSSRLIIYLYTQQSANLSVRMESVCYLIPVHVTVDGLDHAVKQVSRVICIVLVYGSS